MRKTLRCPKCDERRVLHVRHVSDKDAGHQPLSLVSERGTWTWKSRGALEAYVCASCGYTEWYTSKPEELTVDGDVIRLLEGPPREGPFR